VLPEGRRQVDLRLNDGRIEAIGPALEVAAGDEVIDASGLLVLPGIIDAHTHFELDTGKMQTRDDFASGSASAAAGGVTTYVNFAPQQRGQSLVDAVNAERAKAEGHSLVDFTLHLSFGTPGPDWERELEQVVAMGVTSAKVYTTYTDTVYYTRDWDWHRLMRRSGESGLLVMVHAENDDILRGKTDELLAAGNTSFQYHGAARLEVAEVEAVARGLAFCRDTGSPIYFVHLSASESVDLVTAARAEGLPAYGEVCAHHVSLDDRVYATEDAPRYVCTPPMRSPETRERLLQRIVAGRVHSMGSDHCGYSLDQRGSDRDFTAASPGVPGVETLWPVVYSVLVGQAGMSLEDAVALVSARPAANFGLAPRKGSLAVGADADVVLYDPEPRGPLDEASLHSLAGFSPWHGFEIHGRVVRTISRGLTVYDDGELSDDLAHGRFVACAPFNRDRVDAALA
jgi:D-hydantoinase